MKTINIPAPPGLSYYDFQKEDVRTIIDRFIHNRNTLLNEEMGLGKTIEICGLLNTVKKISNVLIVCPAGLKLNWLKELTTWLVTQPSMQIIGPKSLTGARYDITIINYDILQRHLDFLCSENWNLVVLDEAHYVKNPKSLRAKAISKIRSYGKIALTGTPILNRPSELWTILKYLDPDNWGTFYEFTEKYCGAYEIDIHRKNKQGNVVKKRIRINDGTPDTELLKKDIGRIIITRKKNDNLNLPQKIRQTILLEPDENTAKLLEREKEISVLDGPVQKCRKDCDITEFSALLKKTAMAKLPMAVSHIETALLSSHKVVSLAHHHCLLDTLAEKFKNDCVLMTGDTSVEDRYAAVKSFQEDDSIKLFLCSIRTAVGITLTASSHVVFLERTCVPGEVAQAEDRCHRIGQKQVVLVQHLVLKGSIDEKVVDILIKKQHTIDRILG